MTETKPARPRACRFGLAPKPRFYGNVLGFSCRSDRPEDGFSYLALGRAQQMMDQIGLGRDLDPSLGAADRPLWRGLTVQIRVPDLAPLLASLSQDGVLLLVGPEDRWYRRDIVETGNCQIVLADPDGHRLRFFQHLGERPLSF